MVDEVFKVIWLINKGLGSKKNGTNDFFLACPIG